VTAARARRYGDSLRSGWRNVLDAVIRLHGLGLLPPGVVLLEAGEPDGGKLALPRAPASRRSASASSILSRAFSRRAPALDRDALACRCCAQTLVLLLLTHCAQHALRSKWTERLMPSLNYAGGPVVGRRGDRTRAGDGPRQPGARAVRH
jgi:hypothetical protein